MRADSVCSPQEGGIFNENQMLLMKFGQPKIPSSWKHGTYWWLGIWLAASTQLRPLKKQTSWNNEARAWICSDVSVNALGSLKIWSGWCNIMLAVSLWSKQCSEKN
jgi:hypothetical protein